MKKEDIFSISNAITESDEEIKEKLTILSTGGIKGYKLAYRLFHNKKAKGTVYWAVKKFISILDRDKFGLINRSFYWTVEDEQKSSGETINNGVTAVVIDTGFVHNLYDDDNYYPISFNRNFYDYNEAVETKFSFYHMFLSIILILDSKYFKICPWSKDTGVKELSHAGATISTEVKFPNITKTATFPNGDIYTGVRLSLLIIIPIVIMGILSWILFGIMEALVSLVMFKSAFGKLCPYSFWTNVLSEIPIYMHRKI